MNWNKRHKCPSELDYDTEEEYEEALAAYEDAENDYVEAYLERWKEENYNNQ